MSNSNGFLRGWKYRLSFLTYGELLALKTIINREIEERIEGRPHVST